MKYNDHSEVEKKKIISCTENDDAKIMTKSEK